jgi:serine/threonine-protein kinase
MIAGQIDRAEAVLKTALALDDSSPQLLLKQASILGLKADYKGAVDLLLVLNRQHPKKPAILRRLVLAYEQLRQPERAMAFLKAYDKVSPGEHWAAEKIKQHVYLGSTVNLPRTP